MWRDVSLWLNARQIGQSPEFRSRYISYLRESSFSPAAYETFLNTEGGFVKEAAKGHPRRRCLMIVCLYFIHSISILLLFADNFNCAEHKERVTKHVGKDGIAPVLNYQGILTHSCSGISIPLPNWLAKLKIRLTRENDNVILFGMQ